MNGTKPVYLSKTIWGAVAAIVGGGVTIGNFVLTGADVMQVHELLTGIASSVGGLVAVWGRVKAKHRIG